MTLCQAVVRLEIASPGIDRLLGEIQNTACSGTYSWYPMCEKLHPTETLTSFHSTMSGWRAALMISRFRGHKKLIVPGSYQTDDPD